MVGAIRFIVMAVANVPSTKVVFRFITFSLSQNKGFTTGHRRGQNSP
jgi:hypothetical protein